MLVQNKLINAFDQLGKIMRLLGENQPWSSYESGLNENEYEALNALIRKQFILNGWFTEEAVRFSLKALGEQLKKENLEYFTQKYNYTTSPKKIGVIMAGNLPLVGFHDFLCVLLSGNKINIKLSSDDKTLLPALIDVLLHFLPELKENIEISVAKIGEIDAIIATGSGNSMRYFESYFGHLPHLFRKNRTSIAVLDGTETDQELEALGKDIFTHFGLGCRNVSKLLIPNNFDLNRFFAAIIPFGEIINHHKYANNYDYNKAIYLMNLEKMLDNNFILLKESEELFSPLAVLYYQRYTSIIEAKEYIAKENENLQVIVGHGFHRLGTAQCPTLFDFADGVDTMLWLQSLI
jgi:Acyl-CoA reductase (LuxC)